MSIIRFAAARAVFKPFVSSDAPIVNAMSLDFADKNVRAASIKASSLKPVIRETVLCD